MRKTAVEERWHRVPRGAKRSNKIVHLGAQDEDGRFDYHLALETLCRAPTLFLWRTELRSALRWGSSLVTYRDGAAKTEEDARRLAEQAGSRLREEYQL